MDKSEIFLRAKEMTFWVLNIQQSFFLKSTGIDLIQGAKVKNLKKMVVVLDSLNIYVILTICIKG